METTIGYLKTELRLESLKAKTSNSVRQDIFSHLILLALSAQVQDQAARALNLDVDKEVPSLKNVFMIFREKLFSLFKATRIKNLWVQIIERAKAILWKKQPGRRRPRYSMQPQSRWSSERYRRKKALT